MKVIVQDDAGFELYQQQGDWKSMLRALQETMDQLEDELLRLGELHIRANPK
jgi:hypothetical protein